MPEELQFEEALEELEQINRRLEEGKDSLEESMKLYERGIKLKNLCEKKLKEAEGKWQVLRKQGNEVKVEEIDSDEIPDKDQLTDLQGGLQEQMF